MEFHGSPTLICACAQNTMDTSEPGFCGKNLVEVLEKLQGRFHFEKVLRVSNVGQFSPQRNCISGPCQLSIPRSFSEAHGDKLRKPVVLRTGNKKWSLRLSVCLSRSRPEVTFCAGWRQFVADNGLAKGDKLIFSLTAMSNFKVYIFNNRGESKASQASQASTDEIEQKVNKSLRGNEGEELTTEEFENLIRESCRGRSDDSEEELTSLPAAFRKELRYRPRDSTMEIPVRFARKYGNWLKRQLHVQGIHEDSPTRIVSIQYYVDRGRIRFYLKDGWDEFRRDNKLREGQELVFTLVSDSFLEVRTLHNIQ